MIQLWFLSCHIAVAMYLMTSVKIDERCITHRAFIRTCFSHEVTKYFKFLFNKIIYFNLLYRKETLPGKKFNNSTRKLPKSRLDVQQCILFIKRTCRNIHIFEILYFLLLKQ